MQYGFDSWNQSFYGLASEDGSDSDSDLSADMIGAAYEEDEDIMGCDKMALCGIFRQREVAKFAIHDNRERHDADVKVIMHAGQDTIELPVTPHPNVSFLYEFEYTTNTKGISIMEVFFNGVQIPESPFRVETTSADCGDHLKEAVSQFLYRLVCILFSHFGFESMSYIFSSFIFPFASLFYHRMHKVIAFAPPEPWKLAKHVSMLASLQQL